MEKSGKSYRTLADDIGLAYATIAKLANAKDQNDYDISAYALDKLCRYFKCDVGDILEYKRNGGK
jgi:DNA-binding Xre family transcriptional regulator